MEASLGKLSVQRDLTAFETGSYTAAGASVLTLVTLTCGLAVAGAGTSTNSPSLYSRTFSGAELMELPIPCPP